MNDLGEERMKQKSTALFLWSVVCLALFAPGLSAQAKVTTDEAKKIAKEARIFNYPLVMMYRTMYLQAIDVKSKSYSGGGQGQGSDLATSAQGAVLHADAHVSAEDRSAERSVRNPRRFKGERISDDPIQKFLRGEASCCRPDGRHPDDLQRRLRDGRRQGPHGRTASDRGGGLGHADRQFSGHA
jgi:hypothetical protein